MTVLRLSRQVIPSLRCPEGAKKVDFFDTETKGFLVEIRSTGAKAYYVRYVDIYGKQRQKKLGSTKDLSLKEARSLAARYRIKPVAHQIHEIHDKPTTNALTLREFVENHYLPWAKTAKRSWKTDVSLLANHIYPTFGDIALDKVGKKEVVGLITAKRSAYTPSTVNRILILMRFIYNLASRWEFPGAERNPTRGIDLLKEIGAREKFLDKAETEAILTAVGQSDNRVLKHIVTWLLLTGARKSEALNARWSDISTDELTWFIPHTKSGKPRYVPISNAAREVLRSMKEYKISEYLFANPATGKPYVNIFSVWNTARVKAGMPDLRIHDLRHSAASFLINSGHSLYVVQKLLGHSQQKTTARYSHLSRDALLGAVNSIGDILGLGEKTVEKASA